MFSFLEGTWIFEQHEMVFSLVVSAGFTVFGCLVAKNYTYFMTTRFESLMMWSVPIRCLMITWYATALRTLSYFHGIYGNYPKLSALGEKYPTQVGDVDGLDLFMPLLKVVFLVGFPIFSFSLLRINRELVD